MGGARAGLSAAQQPPRLRLTLSYAGLLLAAGAASAMTIYVVMRYVPNYPLVAVNPRDGGHVASRGEILDLLVKLSGVVLLLLTVIGLCAGWIIADRVLSPLQQITAAANLAATTGSLEHRIGLTGRRDEFTDLSETFDSMLDRLQQSVQEHRRFAANASHELRTPHATTKTMLEVARADPGGQDVDERTRRLPPVRGERARIDIVEALLALAEISQRPVSSQVVDFASITNAATESLRPEALTSGITLTIDRPRPPSSGTKRCSISSS